MSEEKDQKDIIEKNVDAVAEGGLLNSLIGIGLGLAIGAITGDTSDACERITDTFTPPGK